MIVTPRQRELARHALGFHMPRVRQSYRNRFVAMPNHRDWKDWNKMAEREEAITRPAKKGRMSGATEFALTVAAARSVLKPGESLNPVDFP